MVLEEGMVYDGQKEHPFIYYWGQPYICVQTFADVLGVAIYLD